jgi:hypothetical protein
MGEFCSLSIGGTANHRVFAVAMGRLNGVLTVGVAAGPSSAKRPPCESCRRTARRQLRRLSTDSEAVPSRNPQGACSSTGTTGLVFNRPRYLWPRRMLERRDAEVASSEA